jgi:integrase
MNIKAASVKLSFEKTTSDLVSVKLRVTYQRIQRRYAFPIKNGILLSEKEFERLLKYHEKGSERTAEEIRLLYGKVEPHIKKAEHLAETIKPFSFDAFKEAFYKTQEDVKPSDQNNVLAALNNKGAAMRKDDRLGNAVNYELTAKSLQRFVNSFSDEERKEFLSIPISGKSTAPRAEVILRFDHITKDFLKTYEQWMLSFGKTIQKRKEKKAPAKLNSDKAPKVEKKQDTRASLTTVGIYCRHLRSVFNDAITDKLIDPAIYPFGKKGYTIPAGSNIKKALSKADVLQIMNYVCEPDSFEQRGRDLWIFSYLSNGMNMTDICSIKWKDVDKKANSLSFIRKKTARTKKGNQSRIQISLNEESWNIINRYSGDNKPDSYIFPFLKLEMTEQQKKNTVAQVVKMTNQHVRSIAKKLGIDTDVTTYAARHSFATILLQSEVPVAFISQSLGHQNISTTQAYLGSFDDEKTKEYLKALI